MNAREETNMGSEWNRFIDSVGIRLFLIAAGFAVWAVTLIGLLVT
jgi:hypothetical protein